MRFIHSFIHSFIYSFINIQPLGRFGRNQSLVRRPVWLWHCKFLGLGCHYFPPPLEVSTYVTRCLHVHNDARDPSSEKWNYGRKMSGNFTEMMTSTPFRDLLHAKNLRHGTDGFTSPPKEGVLEIFFDLKNPTASAGWKNKVQTGRPHMTIWRMRFACWIPKSTNTHL
jgi:hypothetical protein